MRRGLRKASRSPWAAVRKPVLAVPACLVFVICCYLVTASALIRRRGRAESILSKPLDSDFGCVAWRQTNLCSPFG